ncbi:MAG: flavin reductase family protein [Ruminococcaceae bacterium]|nr:flavin reductase family protein [Oscillospiraceae bacterium]
MEKLTGFREISPYETENALKLIGKDYMLITTPDGEGANAMTASWGCMGVLWNKPVAVCFIRPQRYSFGLAEQSERFSLAFFGSERRDAMAICGKQSGRDIDKMAACGFTLGEVDGVPVISDASLLLVCKKLYVDDLKESCFLDKALLDNYKSRDYHRMYILEIQKTLVRE